MADFIAPTAEAKRYFALPPEEAPLKKEEAALAIFKALKGLPPTARRKEATHLLNIIKQNTSFQKEALIETLKKQSAPYPWKGALVGSSTISLLSIRRPHLEYSNHLEEEILFDKRFSLISQEECSALFGSSFATNKEARRDTEGHALLDAATIQKCYSQTGEFVGHALALADGAGGHFGDAVQDQRISHAAHYGVKELTKHLARDQDQKTLQQELPSILEIVKQKVQEKGKGEGATLLGCRTFPASGGCHLIGLNIGDGILFAYDPHKKKCCSLIPAHQSEAGTAIFPLAYRSFEIHQVNTFLPHGTLLFLASDGLHDLLPFSEEEGIYPNKLTYRKRTLKEKEIEALLSPLTQTRPPEDYLRILIEAGLETLNKERKKSLYEENIQIGDDVSALCLSTAQEEPSVFFSSLKNIWPFKE